MGDEAAPAASFEVVDTQDPKAKWRMLLLPDGLRFESALTTVPPVEVARRERAERMILFNGLILGRIVSIRVEKKNRVFKLSREAWEALEAWYPPYTRADLVAVLKRRLSWSFTIGILYLVPAFLRSGDLTPDLEPMPVDWISAALGGALILMGLVSRIAPSRIFLVVDSLWCAVLVANTIREILAGQGNWFWYVALYFQLVYVRDGVREFLRFAPEKMAPEDA